MQPLCSEVLRSRGAQHLLHPRGLIASTRRPAISTATMAFAADMTTRALLPTPCQQKRVLISSAKLHCNQPDLVGLGGVRYNPQRSSAGALPREQTWAHKPGTPRQGRSSLTQVWSQPDRAWSVEPEVIQRCWCCSTERSSSTAQGCTQLVLRDLHTSWLQDIREPAGDMPELQVGPFRRQQQAEELQLNCS